MSPEEEAARHASIAKNLAAERAAVELLRERGLEVPRIQYFVETRERYPHAIPFLVELLPDVENLAIRTTIVRALTVTEARGKCEMALLQEFRRSFGDGTIWAETLRWTIAAGLEMLSTRALDPAVGSEMVELARDPRSASARDFLALAAAKAGVAEALPVLAQMAQESSQQGPVSLAAAGLRYFATEESIALLEQLTKSEFARTRKIATASLARVRKALAAPPKKGARPRSSKATGRAIDPKAN